MENANSVSFWTSFNVTLPHEQQRD